MNSSSIMKRTLPLIIALVLIIGIAVTITLTSSKKTAPRISNPEDAYLTNDGFVIKNKDAYAVLKVKFGYSHTLELIDRHILKDANGKDYLAAVTEEEIAQAFKDKYGDIEEISEDKRDEFELNLYDQIYFNTGLKTRKEIDESIRLELAKKAFTKDMIVKEQEEHDADEDRDDDYFKESDYRTQLRNNYKEDVAAIIVPFNTQHEVEIALRQLGIKLGKDKKNWVKVVADDLEAFGDDLTLEEVKQAFIDLYNSAFAYKIPTYPAGQLVLQEGVHYKVEEGVIKFIHNDFDKESELVYTQKDLDNLGLATLLYDDLKVLGDSLDDRFYTYLYDRQYSGKYYLVLKIANAEKNELDTVLDNGLTIHEEITNKFIENKASADRISKELAKLRKEKNLVIYDPFISLNYSLQVSDFKETKKTHKTIIAKVDGLEITADMLYEDLAKLYGPTYFSDRLLYDLVLEMSEYNDFFDPKTDKLITKEAQTKYNDEFVEIKKRIKQEYAQYASFISMEEFLLSSYDVQTIEQLKYMLFYRDIIADYRKGYADVEKNWTKYQEIMNEQLEKFFEVRGIHLLIHLQDEKGNPVDPKEWTEYQLDLAKELTDLIKTTLKKEVTGSKTYASVLTKIQDEFNNSPRLVAGHDVDSPAAKPLYDPEEKFPEVDYTYSKFKSAGFVLKYEDLGTITPGQMVEPFEEAVKYMWNLNNEEDKHGDNKARLYDNLDKPYIETQFGFHIFVSTNTVSYKYADTEAKTMPTKEDVLTYIKATEGVKGATKEEREEIQNKYKELSDDVKTAIEVNFMPVYNEFKGVGNDEGEMQPNLADMHLIEQLISIVKDIEIINEAARENITYYLNKKLGVTERSLRFKTE